MKRVRRLKLLRSFSTQHSQPKFRSFSFSQMQLWESFYFSKARASRLNFQTQLHPEYSGPPLGPKIATENKRNFSEEEVRRMRDADVGLQAGSNKGATQAGQIMGNTRHM